MSGPARCRDHQPRGNCCVSGRPLMDKGVRIATTNRREGSACVAPPPPLRSARLRSDSGQTHRTTARTRRRQEHSPLHQRGASILPCWSLSDHSLGAGECFRHLVRGFEWESPHSHDGVTDKLVHKGVMLVQNGDHLVEVIAELLREHHRRKPEASLCKPTNVGEQHNAVD